MNKNQQKRIDTKADSSMKRGQLPPVVSVVETLCRPVRTAKAARKYLARLLVAFQRGEIDSVNAKTSVYILSEYLRATETSSFEEKINLIEQKLKKKEEESK